MNELHASPELHDALHGLTDGTPPNLADLVITGANRRRNRTRTLTVAATVATLVAISLPLVVLHRGPPSGIEPGTSSTLPVPSLGMAPNPTGFAHPPSPGGGPRVLDAFMIAGDPAQQTSELLDRATGRYVKLPFSSITLSPDGGTLAVQSRASGFADPHVQVGVIGRADALAGNFDRVRWLAQATLPPVWSPDGSKLLVDSTPQNQVIPTKSLPNLPFERTLSIFEVGSWQHADLRVTLNLVGYWVPFGWTADSSQLVIPLGSPHSTAEHILGGDMQYVHLDGALGQRVSVEGDSVCGSDAYSPARDRVIVCGIGSTRVVDASDWRTVLTIPDRYGYVVGWYDEGHVIAIKPDDSVRATPHLRVLDLSGHVIKDVAMPGNSNLSVQFRSSVGLAGAAADLGF